ncbi:MAG: AAA family ATPase [Thermoplasmata archaeon]|nr:AAA family ATPase [Thermoplasmata archaeon]
MKKILANIETTRDIEIPADPLSRVIGQERAVETARLAAYQRRHLLLIGPPGIGKSMIAQALALHISQPTEEIRVVHNPSNPERPAVEVLTKEAVYAERERKQFVEGELLDAKDVPPHIAERLGYRCGQCGMYSSYTEKVCPRCQKPKTGVRGDSAPFSDIVGNLFFTLGDMLPQKNSVTTTRAVGDKEEVVVYERAGDKIRMLDQRTLERRKEIEKQRPRKVLVPLERKPFVLATGASETELLGDVRHDPYGGHRELGTQPYERVIPGAIHEAHQGVLFIDELPHLGHLQRYILTAMQEKKFPITGRNPQSAGASVRVDAVPCDFIFVGACNIQDLPTILSPLRSRIIGSGYEVLLETYMPDTDENRMKLAQFIAQEITMDGRIPHATRAAVLEVIAEAGRRAKKMDGVENALTLRLRELGGLVRAAGDLAVISRSEYIDAEHIKKALEHAKTAEEQIMEKYGSLQAGVSRELADSQKSNKYFYWNRTELDGYQ